MWDASAGDKHTLLLADGDCIQPIIYYSGQQVALEMEEEEQQEEEGCAQEAEEEEEEEKLKTGREGRGGGARGGGVGVRGGGGGGYTQQPVLLPFCMNVSSTSRCSPAWRNLVVQQQLHFTSLFLLLLFFLLLTLFLAAPLRQQCVCGRWPVCGTV